MLEQHYELYNNLRSNLSRRPSMQGLRHLPRWWGYGGRAAGLTYQSVTTTALHEGRADPAALFPSSSATWQRRFAHKFAAPECPNLLRLRSAIEQNLHPICFYIKNDYAMGHHVYDQHFYVGLPLN